MQELRESMREPKQSLRRLYLALQFGLKLDLTTIEKEIDRRVALSGTGTADEAIARFALAFMQGESMTRPSCDSTGTGGVALDMDRAGAAQRHATAEFRWDREFADSPLEQEQFGRFW
jgi:hypothetical protein